VDIQTLIILAEEFGLPCIERVDTITIVGEKEMIIWRKHDKSERLYVTGRGNSVYGS
jgi:electron transfer flavoprotein alpha/beta subunit